MLTRGVERRNGNTRSGWTDTFRVDVASDCELTESKSAGYWRPKVVPTLVDTDNSNLSGGVGFKVVEFWYKESTLWLDRY